MVDHHSSDSEERVLELRQQAFRRSRNLVSFLRTEALEVEDDPELKSLLEDAEDLRNRIGDRLDQLK